MGAPGPVDGCHPMKTAILIPSLNRPQRLHDLVMNLRETTSDADRLFCVSDAASKALLDELGEWFLDDSDIEDHRYVTRMNKLVTDYLDDDIEAVFYGSDDVIYRENWLPNAQRHLRGFACVVVNDLRNQNGTQALMRRDYLEHAVFDAPGLAFHPGYLHNYADTEQFATAHKNGEYARAMDAVVEHLHPLFGGENAAPWDATYRVAMMGWDHDTALFNARMALLNAR